MEPGERNLITDVPGVLVGNAQDHVLKSGVSVLTADRPFVASVHVMGGAPGTRETDLLAPDKKVDRVDALVLSGGSAFGLDACSGVAHALREQGRGFRVADAVVPIVPGAILFDLLNGGDKAWTQNPYAAIGHSALLNNSTGEQNVAIGQASLKNNTNGSQNVASGYQTLFTNTTGRFNVANGYQALYSNTTGLSFIHSTLKPA